MKEIRFEKVSKKYSDRIFEWLEKPHVKEFWDNSPEHREDIRIFVDGRKEKSTYFDGNFTYWVGLINDEPFAFLLTDEVKQDEDLPILWKENLSKAGKTICLDFCIGNEKYLGKGLAAITLKAFMDYLMLKDKTIDTFYIDPDEENKRAEHVYAKAGFKDAGSFEMSKGVFTGQTSRLMVASKKS